MLLKQNGIPLHNMHPSYNNLPFTLYPSSPYLASVLRDEPETADRFILSGDYSPFNDANQESEFQGFDFLPVPESGNFDEIESFFVTTSETKSIHLRSHSRSSSNPRDETLESSSVGSPRKLKRIDSYSSSTNSVNSKRHHSSSPDDDLDFQEPTKTIKRVQKAPTSGYYPTFTADKQVDEILSSCKSKRPLDGSGYPLDLPSSWQTSSRDTDTFLEFTVTEATYDQPSTLSTTILSDSESPSSEDKASLK
jgi:hypothetical protein